MFEYQYYPDMLESTLPPVNNCFGNRLNVNFNVTVKGTSYPLLSLQDNCQDYPEDLIDSFQTLHIIKKEFKYTHYFDMQEHSLSPCTQPPV